MTETWNPFDSFVQSGLKSVDQTLGFECAFEDYEITQKTMIVIEVSANLVPLAL